MSNSGSMTLHYKPTSVWKKYRAHK